MKRHLILPALGLGAIAGLIVTASAQGVPLPTSTSTGTPTPSPSPTISETPVADGDVTADIRVELDLPSESSGPMVFQVLGVPVNDEIELIDEAPISNPSNWCGDALVDIAADLSSVEISGGDDYCYFEEAYVYIELHGAEWGDVSLESDTLFLEGENPVAFLGGSFGSGGKGALSAGLHLGPIGEPPTLLAASVEGSVFEAYWFGENGANMGGVASFGFTAPAAEPVDGEPTFTG